MLFFLFFSTYFLSPSACYWFYFCVSLHCWNITLASMLAAPHRPCEHLFQVYFHCHIHFRVSHQDLCQRILCHALHFPAGSLELAGFHRHRHGVRHNVDWFCHSQARLRELIVLLFAHSVFFINATVAAEIDEPIVGGRDLCVAAVRLRCPWQIRRADPVIR